MNFKLSNKKLKTLPPEIPTTVDDFDCSNNNLLSLKGCPEKVNDGFDASDNSLSNLIGGPKYVGGDYFVMSNSTLTSLEGGPEYVGVTFSCEMCGLTSLKDIHQHVKRAPYMYLSDNPIESHVLGLFLIKGLRQVWFIDTSMDTPEKGSPDYHLFVLQEIVNKYLPMGKAGLIKCQMELISNGLDAYAQI